MKDDIALLQSASGQVSEAESKLAEKIKTAVNLALGADAVAYVLVRASNGKVIFDISGKLASGE